MKRYYHGPAESDLGEGVMYVELDDDWPTRQVERYGDRWFNSLKLYDDEFGGGGLGDQRIEQADLDAVGAEEISASDFEAVWQASLEPR